MLVRRSGRLIGPFDPNARPSGASPPSQSRRATFAGPGFRPAYWALRPKRSTSRGAVAPPSQSPRAAFSAARRSGWLIFALWAQNAQPPGASPPFAVAPCHLCWPRVPAGLFSPFGLKTLSLQELRPLRPVPASLAQRSGRLIFALRAQNARPAGASPPSQSPRATFAGPAFRLAYWAIRPKRSAFRSAGADPSASPCASFAGPGFRLAYFRPLGSKRSAPRGFAPFAVAPCQLCWPRVPAGLFSPFGLKTLGLQGLRPLRSRPVPPLRAQGSGWLIFALWAQNAQPAGASPPSQSPRATFAGTTFRPAYFRPLGSKRSASRGFAPFASCPRSLRGHLRAKMRSALLPLRMFFPRVRQSLRRVRGSPLWGSPLRRPSR